jgi:hypothetical protein
MFAAEGPAADGVPSVNFRQRECRRRQLAIGEDASTRSEALPTPV